MANERPISDARNSFLRELIRDAHATDPARLVSAALQNQEAVEGNRFLIHIKDPIANDLDVMGNNEYIGWKVRRPRGRGYYGLDGTTPWILKDFRSPRRALRRIKDYFNRKGLVSAKNAPPTTSAAATVRY